MANASPPAVQSWHEPTSLWLVPKSEEATPWETLQKHWGGVTPSNQTHQQRRRPDRNTRLAQTLDRCDNAQWRLHWRPVNVFCKILIFKVKTYSVQNFWNDPRIERAKQKAASFQFFRGSSNTINATALTFWRRNYFFNFSTSCI